MKKAIMYGAGNIGRGFIGQLFSMSGYEVVFIDINPTILERLNTDHNYPIRIVTDGNYSDILVSNVRGVSAANIDEVSFEIATADIMATAVGVNILPRIAKPIASALKKRWEIGNFSPLNVIICENMLNADKYLSNLIRQDLNENEIKYFDALIGFVESSIGRMVPVMTPEMQEGNPLRVYVEEYCELPVDKDAFKGVIPEILNMHPFSPFDFYIQRKLFMHNMGHATTAYLGFLKGYKYIWEASRDSTIKLITLRALQESSLALSCEHNISLNYLIEHTDDLVYRFGNKLLGDTVARVGKDPVRKLSENDRFVGASKLCIKQGKKPIYISIGLAAGFRFVSMEDEFSIRIQEYIKTDGIENAVKEFCRLTDSDELFGFVIEFYKILTDGYSLEHLLEYAESKENIYRRAKVY